MLICNAFSLNMLAQLYVDIRIRPLTVEQARTIAADYADSAVGHSNTAAVFSGILGVEVPMSREAIQLAPGDTVLVGQYRGPRLPEGATELPENAHIDWAAVTVLEPAPVTRFFAWYNNQSDPRGMGPYWEGIGWIEAESPEEAAQKAKADGCQWTTVCVTESTGYPQTGTILATA